MPIVGPAAHDSRILLLKWLYVYVRVYCIYTRVLVAVVHDLCLCAFYDWLIPNRDIDPNILWLLDIKVSAY
jgi:hypothetical protein